jgi:histidinol-phosphatase (PHP family)
LDSRLTDYHTHTPLCRHATGTPAEYIEAALARGLAEIGFADHSPMPERFDDWRMLIEDLPRYVEMILAARERFLPFPVRLGLEVDYFPGAEPWIEKLAGLAEWDYLIGSVHYIAPGWDVDNPKWIGRFNERPVEEIWDLYWRACEQCVRSGLFDFLAHPDLVKKFGHRPAGDLTRFYEPVIAAALENKLAFELNTAGLRKPVREMYPAADFLRLAHSAGLRLVINSDAHAPEEVGADFEAAVGIAASAGYREVLRFHRRVGTPSPLPLPVGG